jgi:hypothetical protein
VGKKKIIVLLLGVVFSVLFFSADIRSSEPFSPEMVIVSGEEPWAVCLGITVAAQSGVPEQPPFFLVLPDGDPQEMETAVQRSGVGKVCVILCPGMGSGDVPDSRVRLKRILCRESPFLSGIRVIRRIRRSPEKILIAA